MEKHKCKLCFRSFSNGRALGGHMRSHMMNFVPLTSEPEEPPFLHPPARGRGEEAESASSPPLSPSSSGGEAEAEEEDLCYGLRENPKRSFRISDPEFSSFAVDAGSVILQDRESETESPKNPTRRRRSNRYLNQSKIQSCSEFHEEEGPGKAKLRKLSYYSELWTEPEPVSSISDATTEEDVAFCLMMLSRDSWTKRPVTSKEDEEDEEDEEKSMEETDSEELKFPKIQNGRKYQCETCKRAFRSYQALGGHRASHKKMKLSSTPMVGHDNAHSSASMADKRTHECPVCFKVFSSGQALGGHKRSHVTGLSSIISAKTSTTKRNLNLIDLNLPAPIDEEHDASQIELSAVSDSEFVKPIRI